MVLLEGTVLADRYRVIRPLGQGGFGAAYLVQDQHLPCQWVAKASLIHDASHRKRFEEEAAILAGLRHPNLPLVTDSFIQDDGPYLIMEYIEGTTLDRLREERTGPFNADEVLRWAHDMLDALKYLHNRKPPILHRDIKPSNVCITPEGRAMLLDFGIARRLDDHKTRSGAVAQSMHYSPIEQYPAEAMGSYARLREYLDELKATGVHTGPYSDIYSLGATLYFALTLLDPPDACWRKIEEGLQHVRKLNPDVPEFVAEALDKALAVDPRERWQTAAEFKQMLQPKQMVPDPHSISLRATSAVQEPTFFSRPVISRNLIDRTDETANLFRHLADDSVTVLCMAGSGGVGKTQLAAWLAQEALSGGWRVRWVNCAERDVTGESFLAAAAGEASDPNKAAVILDRDLPDLDRLDAALDVLETEPTVIVMDDFHKVTDSAGMQKFLSHIVQRSSGDRLKFVLAARVVPPCIDHPTWPPGVTRLLRLSGLPREFISQFLSTDFPNSIGDQQIEFVWERTSGHPYAMGLLKSLVRKHGWAERVRTLPLYGADQDSWFATLVEALDDKQRQLAQRLSVVRTALTDDLISVLWDDREEALWLARELRSRYVLQPTGQSGSLTMYDFLREYLYDHMAKGERRKCHRKVGLHFVKLAQRAEGNRAQADYYGEAVYHLAEAGQKKELLGWAERAFELLGGVGDWSRAHAVANSALGAARAVKDRPLTALWLAWLAGWELDHDKPGDAERHLTEALAGPFQGTGLTPEQRSRMQAIEAQIQIQRGRLAYYTKSNSQAYECFDKALALAKDIHDRHLEAECLTWIGRVQRNLGRFEESAIRFREASTLATAIGDNSLSVRCISHLGLLTRQQGNFEEAKQLFIQARELAMETGDRAGAEVNLSLLGDLLRRTGRYAEAAPIFEEALRISKEITNGLGIRISGGQLAECLIHMGRHEEGRLLLDEVERRSGAVQDGIGLAWCLKRRGELLKFEGKLEEGNRLIQQGIDKLQEMGSAVYLPDFEKALDLVPG